MRVLVLEGGGMRAGFVAGAVMALMDEGWTDFDAAVAVSASVPTLAYFATGQREDIEQVWRRELCSPRLVCYRNIPAASLALSTERPVVNIDYLVDDVFKAQHPLDLEALHAADLECRFAATRVPEGALALLNPREHEVYTLMKACLAVPGCYPGTVSVDACEYLDGGTVHPLPFLGPLHDGGDQVLAILSKPQGSDAHLVGFWEKLLFWRYFHRYDWMEEKLLLAEQSYHEHVTFLAREAQSHPTRALALHPDCDLPARFLTRNEHKLNETIDLGYQAVVAHGKALDRFFEAGSAA